ncbi:hypothetical protein PTSG_09133 [Salpingoeca rosetta]|uniref:Heterokaryon incompatibility domain-containing protein n=1 Tax=Salpingoeca rosetta (strain ATCC 50818 / BSB-021) TaxID=946362 RepID=F2UMT9_SALR5|nr:uncharacterized protein PTSG_09133 [Salpingoeca rosetta]EGD78438.1 hypothetical protein PTSG_09133 [Salpingoeca rosetta]|eukprot:XP_004989387.1 hypothetical protein PTSG_09133 [Salpingoeca rosetta]
MSSTLQQPLLPLHSDKDGAVEDFGRARRALLPETVALADLWTTRGPPQYCGLSGGAQALKERVSSVLKNWKFQAKCRQIGANPTLQRLRIVKQSGLPPMRVLPAAWLKARNGACRIPRSHEGLTVDAEQAVCTSIVNKCRPVIVMVSHRWLDPDNHRPDDEDNSKAKALFEFTKWLEWKIQRDDVTGVPKSQHPLIFLWIDWACINQGDDIPETEENMPQLMKARAPYIDSLSVYTACCHLVTCFEGAGPDDYGSRPWCLVERIAAYVYIPNGQLPFIVQDGFVHQQQLPTRSKREVIDPLQYLDKANEHDAPHIRDLTAALLGRRQLIVRPPCNSDSWGVNVSTVRIGATITALELRADSVVTEAPTSDEQDEDTVVFDYKRGDDEDEQREETIDQVDPECREYREVDVQVV